MKKSKKWTRKLKRQTKPKQNIKNNLKKRTQNKTKWKKNREKTERSWEEGGKKVTLPTHPIFFNNFSRIFFIFYPFLHLEHNPFAFAYLFCYISVCFIRQIKSKLCVNKRRTKAKTEDDYIAERHIAYIYQLLKLGEKWLKIASWYLLLFLPNPAKIIKLRKQQMEIGNILYKFGNCQF